MTVYANKPAFNVREKLKELEKPSGIAGRAMLAADTPQEQFNLIGAGRRNRIINGDMRIDQRNAGASVSMTGGSPYILDQWRFWANGSGGSASYTVQQSSTGPAGFTNSCLITQIA